MAKKNITPQVLKKGKKIVATKKEVKKNKIDEKKGKNLKVKKS